MSAVPPRPSLPSFQLGNVFAPQDSISSLRQATGAQPGQTTRYASIVYPHPLVCLKDLSDLRRAADLLRDLVDLRKGTDLLKALVDLLKAQADLRKVADHLKVVDPPTAADPL
ncbi:hypothetical protein BD311DRAFT_811340 [Dichomitus squalens]|uniref:Uncharacterized protein n=1 Tax=Dichomitus squalens TaxID=114155 RepID=A0A4Q9MAD9_9APHY|nr:hypothetical protein BD311DRAFT_811340 [Dichomitus squalens]